MSTPRFSRIGRRKPNYVQFWPEEKGTKTRSHDSNYVSRFDTEDLDTLQERERKQAHLVIIKGTNLAYLILGKSLSRSSLEWLKGTSQDRSFWEKEKAKRRLKPFKLIDMSFGFLINDILATNHIDA